MCVMTAQAQAKPTPIRTRPVQTRFTLAPKFQQVKYNITTGDNVTVNGQNSTTARGGESLTFTAVPPAGQNVTGWTVNGEAVAGNGNTLTWTVENGCLTKPNVTSYHVEAQFSAGEYKVTYSQPANGTLSASVAAGHTGQRRH